MSRNSFRSNVEIEWRSRFFLIKKLAAKEGRDFAKLSEAELESYWEKAKSELGKG